MGNENQTLAEILAILKGYNPAGGGAPTGPAGGDLAGTYPNPTVQALSGPARFDNGVGVGVTPNWTGNSLGLYIKGNGGQPNAFVELDAGVGGSAGFLVYSASTATGFRAFTDSGSGYGLFTFAIRNEITGSIPFAIDPTDVATFTGVVGLGSFTLGTLPTPVAGGIIYVSDATGGGVLCFCDGSDWISVKTGVPVA